jgi:tetratricopeptide (TPR) repeat protein
MKIFIVTLIIASFNVLLMGQEFDIVPYLKRVENGEAGKVLTEINNLKLKNKASGSIIFLEGVLTDDGERAVEIYKKVANNFTQSKYADAALYRIFTYYYSTGRYDSSRVYLSRLKKGYKDSPYIKIAERDIPVKNEQYFIEKPAKLEKIAEAKGRYNRNEVIAEKKEYKFTIQAGAFTNEVNGKKLKSDFEKSGFNSEILEKNIGGTIFHVVMVGQFVTEDEAISFLQFLNSEFKLNGRIVKKE